MSIIHPAYEDAFFFLWEEAKLPINVDPYKANLDDPLERKKLAELLVNGMATPAGYVIPVEWNFWNDRWLSGKWVLKNDQLILIPGNSPLGLRLPSEVIGSHATTQIAEAGGPVSFRGAAPIPGLSRRCTEKISVADSTQ